MTVHSPITLAFQKELQIAHHLDSYLTAPDNVGINFVYSSMPGGPHLYCFAPSLILRRNFWTIVTMGTSNNQLSVPSPENEFFKTPQRVELLCYLPANWSFPVSLGQELNEQNWPLEFLRAHANLVSAKGEHISEGQSYSIQQMFDRLPQDFQFTHTVLIDTCMSEPLEFRKFSIENEDNVLFYSMIPLTTAEFEWKEETGLEESLFEIIGRKRCKEDIIIDFIIDPSRKCSVKDYGAKEKVAAFFASLLDDFEDLDDKDDIPYFVHSSFAHTNPFKFAAVTSCNLSRLDDNDVDNDEQERNNSASLKRSSESLERSPSKRPKFGA